MRIGLLFAKSMRCNLYIYGSLFFHLLLERTISCRNQRVQNSNKFILTNFLKKLNEIAMIERNCLHNETE